MPVTSVYVYLCLYVSLKTRQEGDDSQMVVACRLEVGVGTNATEDAVQTERYLSYDLQALDVQLLVDWLVNAFEEDVVLLALGQTQ